MLDPAAVFAIVREQGIHFFTGVPDSLLKDFCAYVTDHTDSDQHVITANEGNAVALAAGHFLGSGEPALVYMQNSGFGNSINPLLSLADPDVYSIPMLLMVGWRGQPGTTDEPQHIKQGRVQEALLEAMEIPWVQLTPATDDPAAVIAEACARMRAESRPVVVLVHKGAFAGYELIKDVATEFTMNRERAVKLVVDALEADDVVVSTTGMTSREVFEYREERGDGHENDFLTVGSMGHTSSIAMGVARMQPHRKVVCLDGDGSMLMHLGALAVIGQLGPPNLLHVVINNGAHDSVGGQPTVGFAIDLPAIAKACGYVESMVVEEPGDLTRALEKLRAGDGPSLLEVRVNKGARGDLGRPTTTPLENRDAFMTRLGIDPGPTHPG
jgi:phosphonopyruvate decarboxylase